MHVIKVAVVGYGPSFNMGRQHLTQMRDAGMTPVAVCDTDPVRLKAAEEEFPGIATYSTVDALLQDGDADLITVITPHDSHTAVALQCLNAGKHVVIEKPMTITTQQCDSLIAAANAHGVVLSTYHNRHWDGHLLEALQHISAGEIGDVFRIECHMGAYDQPSTWWRSQRSVSGGILYDWGVHLLEYSLQILAPASMTEVSGYAKAGFWADSLPFPNDANEDEGHLTVRFDDGRWLSLNISSIDAHNKGDRGILEITGTKGTYLMYFDKWVIRTKTDGVLTIREGKNQAGQTEKFYQNIEAAISGREALVITPEWARRPVHILDLAVQSASSGTSLPVKYA
jgi:predicted dehydrogenase